MSQHGGSEGGEPRPAPDHVPSRVGGVQMTLAHASGLRFVARRTSSPGRVRQRASRALFPPRSDTPETRTGSPPSTPARRVRAHGTSETHVALLPPRPPPRIASASVIGCLASDPTDPKRVYYLAGSNVVSAPLLTAGQQAFLRGHDSDVTCMAVSQSGRLMATGQNGINADVCVWDLHTGELLHRLSEHDEGVATLAFSPDERLLVSCGVAADKKIFLWDTETGCIVAKGVCAPEECRAVAFSPSSKAGDTTSSPRREPTSSCGDAARRAASWADRSAASGTRNARTAPRCSPRTARWCTAGARPETSRRSRPPVASSDRWRSAAKAPRKS